MRELIGQRRLWSRLTERALTGGIAHAYVLSGPRSIGKRTAAIRLAQTLNCASGSAGGCGTCVACVKIERGSHPDVLMVSRLVNREKSQDDAKNITIDQIREMQRDLALRPLEGRRRVVIIDDAADLNEHAETALLKTLEEPPQHALLLLLTPTPARMLPTVLSRAQALAFRLVAESEIAAGLVGRFGAEAARHAAGSGGRPGLAIRLATDDGERSARHALDDELYQLLSAGTTARFAWAADLADEKDMQKRLRAIDLRFAHWSELIRDAVLARHAGTRLLRGDRAAQSQALAADSSPRMSSRVLVDTLLLIQRFHDDLVVNANARAMLELFALKLPHSAAAGR